MKLGIRLLDWHWGNAILNAHFLLLSFGIGADRFSSFLRGARGALGFTQCRIGGMKHLPRKRFKKNRIKKPAIPL